MKKMNKKGFTIVELVIVIAVIAILAGVMIPTFGGIIDKANKSNFLQEVKGAYTATLTEDLDPANDEKADEVYEYESAIIVIESEGEYYVEISENGEAVVKDVGNETVTPTHTLESDKLKHICDKTGTGADNTKEYCSHCGAVQE